MHVQIKCILLWLGFNYNTYTINFDKITLLCVGNKLC